MNERQYDQALDELELNEFLARREHRGMQLVTAAFWSGTAGSVPFTLYSDAPPLLKVGLVIVCTVGGLLSTRETKVTRSELQEARAALENFKKNSL